MHIDETVQVRIESRRQRLSMVYPSFFPTLSCTSLQDGYSLRVATRKIFHEVKQVAGRLDKRRATVTIHRSFRLPPAVESSHHAVATPLPSPDQAAALSRQNPLVR